MSDIRASAHQLASLSDFSDVKPRGPEDQACIDEIRQVLEKHNALDRFGLTLLHKHFDTPPGHILKEHCDPTTLTLTIRPVPKNSMEKSEVMATAWDLRQDSELIVCLGTGVC